MVSITFPSSIHTTDVIDKIRTAIGRPVTFTVISDTAECSICSLDPNTGTSVDSFCPECNGEYYILTYSGVQVSGHVTWREADDLQWVTGGQLLDGDCKVQIKHTPQNLTIIDTTETVNVDGKIMEIDKKIFRGVPTINRIILLLKEVEDGG